MTPEHINNLFIGILCMFPFLYFMINSLSNPKKLEDPPEEMRIKGQTIMIVSLGLFLMGLVYIWRSV